MKKIIIFIGFIIIFIYSYSKSEMKEYKLGDKITVSIKNSSIDEVKEALKNYQLEKIIEENGNIIVEIRSFNLGENNIKINDKDIKFNILTNITPEEKNIYLDLSDKSNKKMWTGNVPYILIVSFFAFIGSLILIFKKEKRIVFLTSEEKFQNKIQNINQENYYYELSYLIREYIDSELKLNYLNGLYKENEIIDKKDIEFIKKLDYLKFSEEKNGDRNELIIAVRKLHDKIVTYKKEKEMKNA